jgi:hypothetical protein
MFSWRRLFEHYPDEVFMGYNVNTIKSLRILVLLAPAFLVATAFAACQSELEKAMSHDGLQKISVKGIDLVYARPGATLAAYSRVKLEPVEVSFLDRPDPCTCDRPA